VNAIYVGGGTPGALSARQIDRILETVNEYIPMANDCELTFEARTFEFDAEKIETCLENGVSRFSLEVLSFDTLSRHAIGRMDDGDVVTRKIEELKKYNSAAVSIDLMYGLPYQTEADFISDFLHADKLEVDGISFRHLNSDAWSQLEDIPKPASTAQQSIYHI
jgi:oxygen-independent coproporphyrinogen-3 oxidase